MPPRVQPRNPLVSLAIGVLGGWVVLWLLWKTWIAGVVQAAASGQGGFDFLIQLIESRRAADPAWADPEHAIWVARTVMTRCGIVWAAMVAMSLLVLRRRTVARRVGGQIPWFDSSRARAD